VRFDLGQQRSYPSVDSLVLARLTDEGDR